MHKGLTLVSVHWIIKWTERNKTEILHWRGLLSTFHHVLSNKKSFLCLSHCVKHTVQPSLLLSQTAVMIFRFSGRAWRWLWSWWCYDEVDDDIDVINVDDSDDLSYIVISAPTTGDRLTYLCNVSVAPRCQTSSQLGQTKLKRKHPCHYSFTLSFSIPSPLPPLHQRPRALMQPNQDPI